MTDARIAWELYHRFGKRPLAALVRSAVRERKWVNNPELIGYVFADGSILYRDGKGRSLRLWVDAGSL